MLLFFVLKYSGVDLIMHIPGIPITELTSERMPLVLKENFLKEKRECASKLKVLMNLKHIACNRSKSCTHLGPSNFSIFHGS